MPINTLPHKSTSSHSCDESDRSNCRTSSHTSSNIPTKTAIHAGDEQCTSAGQPPPEPAHQSPRITLHTYIDRSKCGDAIPPTATTAPVLATNNHSGHDRKDIAPLNEAVGSTDHGLDVPPPDEWYTPPLFALTPFASRETPRRTHSTIPLALYTPTPSPPN